MGRSTQNTLYRIWGRRDERELLGYFLLMLGVIILAVFKTFMGLVITAAGVIVVINPSRARIMYELRRTMAELGLMRGIIVEVIGLFLMALGIAAIIFGLVLKNILAPMGVVLFLTGVVILPGASRERLVRFIRNPGSIFDEYTRGSAGERGRSGERMERYRRERIEIPQTRRARKRPKGFSQVKSGEYTTIPKDAIDSFTQGSIHDIITGGGHIVKCKDCGALYDVGVWKYYGKKCVRIGCSNADI